MTKLSIIIPVYNEKKTLLEVLRKIEAVTLPLEKEIILIDDGSTDGTREIYRGLDSNKYKIFLREKNEGKGAALKDGFSLVSGDTDIVLIQDADLEYDPAQYLRLVAPIIKGETEVVYGSRNLIKNPRFKKSYYLGVRLISWLTSLFYGSRLTDVYTCYKVFKKSVLDNLELVSRGFEIEQEITAKILKKNYQIIEVPIKYQPRGFREGKKLNWREGFKAILVMIKYRFKE